ncbi:hypothetical protein EVAR_49862_1 [Eumeta japonica]|uniref:Uncharacterized protein n=1 Tax=Eumeta variegata TaxID=151549 RepID=A0A4C1XU36_EUMVA|nr:hypothetical protein EVAR_49862_1 [Eumeta japonica]
MIRLFFWFSRFCDFARRVSESERHTRSLSPRRRATIPVARAAMYRMCLLVIESPLRKFCREPLWLLYMMGQRLSSKMAMRWMKRIYTMAMFSCDLSVEQNGRGSFSSSSYIFI